MEKIIDGIKPPSNPSVPIKPNRTTIKTPVDDRFKQIIATIDANAMPVLAWFVLIGLAVRGALSLLANMSSDIRVSIAILVVAFFAFKLR